MIEVNRDLLVGLLTALISILIFCGSLFLSMAEDQSVFAQRPQATATASATATPLATTTASATATPLPTLPPGDPTYTPSSTQSPSSTPSPTETPTPTDTGTPAMTKISTCDYPSGWNLIIVNSGDTLEDLADTYDTTEDALRDGNCLLVDSLIAGSDFYVPQKLSPTATFVPCGPPAGWVFYTVKSGDTLFKIGRAYGVTVAQLQQANCLGNSDYIRAGQSLFVPYVARNTSTATRTPSFTPSPTNTHSLSPSTETATSTLVVIPSATRTPTDIPSDTPTATDVPTSTNTATEVPTETSTPVPTATETTNP